MSTRTRILAALALGVTPLHASPLQAQQRPADSTRTRDRSPLITRREAVIGLAGTAATVGLMQFDSRIMRWVRDPARQAQGVRDFGRGLSRVNERSLFVAEMLLWGAGRLTGREGLADASWHAAEAVGITTLGTTVVRIGLGRTRPFKTGGRDPFDFHPFKGVGDQAYRSIPSLHAAAAFATAGALTGETYRRRPGLVKVVAPVSFAAAALPGLGRMHADKHWASDIALGAVWGTMIGIATVRWHHEHDDRLDRWMLGAGRAPNGDGVLTIGRRAPRW